MDHDIQVSFLKYCKTALWREERRNEETDATLDYSYTSSNIHKASTASKTIVMAELLVIKTLATTTLRMAYYSMGFQRKLLHGLPQQTRVCSVSLLSVKGHQGKIMCWNKLMGDGPIVEIAVPTLHYTL